MAPVPVPSCPAAPPASPAPALAPPGLNLTYPFPGNPSAPLCLVPAPGRPCVLPAQPLRQTRAHRVGVPPAWLLVPTRRVGPCHPGGRRGTGRLVTWASQGPPAGVVPAYVPLASRVHQVPPPWGSFHASSPAAHTRASVSLSPGDTSGGHTCPQVPVPGKHCFSIFFKDSDGFLHGRGSRTSKEEVHPGVGVTPRGRRPQASLISRPLVGGSFSLKSPVIWPQKRRRGMRLWEA